MKRAERCSEHRQEVKDPRAEHSTEGRGEGSLPGGFSVKLAERSAE